MFLYQRARQWKISDISDDPMICIEVPTGYPVHIKAINQNTKVPARKRPAATWLETNSSSSASVASRMMEHFKLAAAISKPTSKRDPELRNTDYDYNPISVGFGGGPGNEGECVFTNIKVQRAILEFFEEVIQNPLEYCNPTFAIDVRRQKNSSPKTFTVPDPHEAENATFDPITTTQILSQQQEINEYKQKITAMKDSLSAIPKDNEELNVGKRNLEMRILKAEESLVKMQAKAPMKGGSKAGGTKEAREKWEGAKTSGPKITFAGRSVPFDLIKGAGLLDTCNEALRDMDSGAEADGPVSRGK